MGVLSRIEIDRMKPTWGTIRMNTLHHAIEVAQAPF